jgi:hypothetical protein
MRQCVVGFVCALAAVSVSAQPPEVSVTDQVEGQALPLDALTKELRATQREVSRLKDELQDVQGQQRVIAGSGSYAPSFLFMPPPADPNNPFRNELTDDINLGAGSRVMGTPIIFRSAVDGSAQMTYDTGFVGPLFRPTIIALDGTALARKSGMFDLTASNAKLDLDVQVPIQSFVEQAQGYLEMDLVGDELRVRHAYARVGNIIAGQYWTAWGDEGALPKALGTDLRPAGSVFDRPAQVRIAFPHGPLVTTFAVQRPLNGDFTPVSITDTILQRWPDFAARIRYFDGDFASVSVGSLLRVMGIEGLAGQEDFAVGWGISATARFRVGASGAAMLGCVGGEGIAGTVYGLSPSGSAGGPSAVAMAGGRLLPLENIGAYVGYQQIWMSNCQSSFAYGYSLAEGTPAMPALAVRKTHNAWANLIYQLNESFAFGIEYSYGKLEALDNTPGENHRFLFVIALTTSKRADRQAGIPGAPESIPSLNMLPGAEPLPADTGASRFSRL